MKCEKCRKKIDSVEVDMFQPDGSNWFKKHTFDDAEDEILITTSPNWTGYELTEEEMVETIRCPHCKQFPFVDENIEVSDNEVFITLFKNGANTMSRINKIKQMNTKEFAEFLLNFQLNPICAMPLTVIEDWLEREL